MIKHSSSALLGAAAIVIGTTAFAPAFADSVADFYGGRTVTVIVPSGSGGTFHLYGQLVSRHIGKYIPGNPNVIVQNRPGGGGVKASNYMANAAPKDGTVIAEMNPGATIVPLMRKVRYDPRKFQWLGTVTVRTYTGAVWHTVATDSLEKVRKTQVITGASGVGSLNYQVPYFMNKVLGTKFKIISGYKGGGAINLAMERGEVQGRWNFYSGYTGAKPGWIRDKKVKFMFQMGPTRPEVKGVPHVRDLIKGDLNRKMFALLEVPTHVGQSFYVPEGVPKARVAALRSAFVKMLKDPDMQAEAKKRRVPLNSRSYQSLEKVINSAFNVPKEVSTTLAKILRLDKRKKKKK